MRVLRVREICAESEASEYSAVSPAVSVSLWMMGKSVSMIEGDGSVSANERK